MRVLHKIGRIHVRLPGGKGTFDLVNKGDEGYSSQTFWWGWDAIEPETLSVWYYLTLKARTILDIGAYIGEMSLIAAKANPNSAVYAFEPLPSTFERLRLHQQINRAGNLHCLNLAVSDSAGVLPFYHQAQADGLSPSNSLSKTFLNTNRTDDFVAHLEQTDVTVVTVDEWALANDVTGVDLVKIDTETVEPQVVRGMLEVIKRDRPDIIVECLGLSTILQREITDADREQFPWADTQSEIDAILLPLGYQRRRLINRTARHRMINDSLNLIAERNDERTHNLLYSARGYDIDAMLAEADRASELI